VIEFNLQDFDVDASRGFLPNEDPACELPDYYRPWDYAIGELPKRLMAGNVRRWLRSLPTLGVDRLGNQKFLNRAMLILSYMGHAWVWGERDVSDHIPENIALPWYEVARQLGRPPVLSYASHALNNWRRLDPDQPIELGNILRLANFLGGIDEEWFVLIHIAIEAQAGPALQAAFNLQNQVRERHTAGAVKSLRTIGRVLATLRTLLERMPENCDPYIYYHRVRPFIFGWEGNPSLPTGVFYDGVPAWKNRGLKFRGETGAQSSIIPVIDAVLGLRFGGNEVFAQHLLQLRDYMPPKHKRLIEILEENENELRCRTFAMESRDKSPDIADAYNAALREMATFRSLHLSLASRYIAAQQPQVESNPTGTGTGGTPFTSYLDAHIQETLKYRL
jgi:indoleamine 2,3-dioxygenase